MKELGFVMNRQSISGRFYSVRFTSLTHAISISYEPGDNTLTAVVFNYLNGTWSDIDDLTKTPRIADLNRRFMSTVTSEQYAANQAFFKSVIPKDSEEKLLLKIAQELRLVLPKYMRATHQ